MPLAHCRLIQSFPRASFWENSHTPFLLSYVILLITRVKRFLIYLKLIGHIEARTYDVEYIELEHDRKDVILSTKVQLFRSYKDATDEMSI